MYSISCMPATKDRIPSVSRLSGSRQPFHRPSAPQGNTKRSDMCLYPGYSIPFSPFRGKETASSVSESRPYPVRSCPLRRTSPARALSQNCQPDSSRSVSCRTSAAVRPGCIPGQVSYLQAKCLRYRPRSFLRAKRNIRHGTGACRPRSPYI